MGKRNIVVMGASAGGFAALKRIVADLPSNLNASIFIVWHMSPEVRGVLPDVLNKAGGPLSANAVDKETVKPGRIYIASPDHHLILNKDEVRVTRGPKENRFRPAIDPLFRSAAYAYGNRVIGVVLSGALDDGTAGLWTIKQNGGTAIVQDPLDAEVPDMPHNALHAVNVDFKLPAAEIGELITRLVEEDVAETKESNVPEKEKTLTEIRMAMADDTLNHDTPKFGDFTPYTCPECHGVLSSLKEGGRVRFRCHTGHGYTSESLLASIAENIEESLWNAIRSMEESIMLLNHMGDHFAEMNQPKLAAVYFKKAKEAEGRSNMIRETVVRHERLNAGALKEEAAHDIQTDRKR